MSKKLFYSAANADTLAASDFVGAHLYAGDTKLTKTQVGAKEALDVYIANSLTVNLDGVYDGVNNLDPDNVGLIAHSRGASPADADQIERLTSGAASSDNVVAANVHGLDVNSFGMLYDGTTWDRWLGTGGAAHVHDGGGSLTVDFTSDPALANADVDNGEEAIADTATKVIPSDLSGRKYVWLYNNDNSEVYLGKQSGLATTNGFPIYPGIYLSMRMGAAIALHGIAKSGRTVDIRNLQLS